MIGGNIRKEVLKRENRYKFYDKNNKLIKEEFYYKDVDTGIERPKPYFVNLITYDEENNSYEKSTYYAKNKGRKLRIVFKKNGTYHNDNGPAMIYYGAESENFKLFCKFYKNGFAYRDFGPCSFKIMNDNSYSEEKYVLGEFFFDKKEYDNIVYDIKNNHINFKNFPFLSEELLNSLKRIAKAYKKQDLIDQIISIQIVNKLTNNDAKMDVW